MEVTVLLTSSTDPPRGQQEPCLEEELAFSIISSSGKVVRLLTSPQGSCLSLSGESLPQLTPRPHHLGASVPGGVWSEGEGVYMCAKSLCDPVDCRGSSVPEILQARMLEWIATEDLLFTSYCAKHIHYYINRHGPINNVPFFKKEIQPRLYWGPCCSSGRVRINRFPCCLAP